VLATICYPRRFTGNLGDLLDREGQQWARALPAGPRSGSGIRLGQSGLCPSDSEGVEPAVVAADAA